MFIFSYYDLCYIIVIFILLLKLTNLEDEKNNIYYLFNYYNPIRELYDKNTLYDVYQESYIKYFDKKDIPKQNFHIILESTVAELLINLFQEKNNTNDPYIEVKIKTKIHLLLKNYEILYETDSLTLYRLNVSLMHRIIDILSETKIDIFNIYQIVIKFLKNNKSFYQEFEIYVSSRNKIDLNYEKISFKKDNLIKYSGEFIKDNLKSSKWMYSPMMSITN